MKKVLKEINSLLKITPFTSLLGVVRTILASPLLLTLLFNPVSILFKPVAGLIEYSHCKNTNSLTFFCFFNQSNLGLAKLIVIVILCLIILGYFPQILGILHFYIAYSVQNTMTTIDGGEQVSLVITFWLMLISLFDNRLNHWQKPKNKYDYNKVFGWAFIIVLKIQIAYIYLNSAITKMKNKEWLDGTAVYYYLNDVIFGVPDYFYNLFSFVIETPLIGLITWGTLVIQLLIFATIFASNKVKKVMLYVSIFMHELFAVFLGLISFSLIMLAVLIFYFSPIIQNDKEKVNEKIN
ncbi:sporulation-delaying protein SdpB family protein [Staphylococcus equorum]|uniref:sporulation-delaying protein SdpB family protein n=1 Tax=Staphylococcus equorum TaxID=246432 RepID=UPI002982AE02|nr:sporulation-delaying protein SdpB family protein [Staphylococcus equorum]MDW5470372.1 hypothetical protein [Staphylococcus equorum]